MKHPLTPFVPNGSPAPTVMTLEDVVAFLQIPTSDAIVSLRALRKLGVRVTTFTSEIRCSLTEVMRFVDSQIEETNRTDKASKTQQEPRSPNTGEKETSNGRN